jgi:hypothetical protein
MHDIHQKHFLKALAKNITKVRMDEDTKENQNSGFSVSPFSFFRAFVMRSSRFGSGSAGLGIVEAFLAQAVCLEF